ncbi:hypothetical protein TIFTF001_028361 [Ficus carica]|uniref:Uncharacterized protein n=1 Tax=Ficus carica TaxID=3494 RepID=A0AA88J028_FICCA|nr:hypothetical protein TIFTF001_028361 [Ficus carica]
MPCRHWRRTDSIAVLVVGHTPSPSLTAAAALTCLLTSSSSQNRRRYSFMTHKMLCSVLAEKSRRTWTRSFLSVIVSLVSIHIPITGDPPKPAVLTDDETPFQTPAMGPPTPDPHNPSPLP